ncbi:MAG TPA: family 1 glycosylhydrolase [Thermoleophilaceae bacterium]|nr:family 1 glycosylhydrolase [Thermoleophilaceae bacterium]
MTRRLALLLAVAALAACALASASAGPAGAAKGMEIALQDDASFVSEVTLKRKKALKLASRLHVTRIRVNLVWVAIVNKGRSKKRPKHRRYDFTSYDALINAAKRRGIKLQLTISGFAPKWATGDHKVGCRKIKLGDFKHYVRAVVKHFKHAPVDRYAIWNEPNYRSWNAPLKGNAERYRKMYLAAYKIIRTHHKRAKILIGETSPSGKKGTSTSPIKFLRAMAKEGKLKADGYAHHPYDYRHGPRWPKTRDANAAINNLDNLTDALDKLAKQKKLTTRAGKPLDLYLTEFGYMASGPYKKPATQRAKFLTEAFQIALKNPRVKEMLQYLLAPPPPFGNEFDTSIVTKKGKPTKPFRALEEWTAKQAKAHLIARPVAR